MLDVVVLPEVREGARDKDSLGPGVLNCRPEGGFYFSCEGVAGEMHVSENILAAVWTMECGASRAPGIACSIVPQGLGRLGRCACLGPHHPYKGRREMAPNALY